MSDAPDAIDDPVRDEDAAWMREAMSQAREAAADLEVPVGAVVVHRGAIIGRGRNRRETDGDPTAHAEILAIREAARAVGGWRLVDCTIYVTQEPCPMCAGALVNARIERLVYGCDNPKAGSIRTLYKLVEDARLNHRIKVTPGVLAVECGALLSDFFKSLRRQ